MSTPGYESKIGYADPSTLVADVVTWPTTYTNFADVTDIKPPKLEADDIETSNMDTKGQVKTFMAGWADAGEVEITLEFASAQLTTLYSLFRVNKSFCIEFNDKPALGTKNSKLFANGYIKSIGPEIDREKLTTVTVTIKVSGATAFEEAA